MFRREMFVHCERGRLCCNLPSFIQCTADQVGECLGFNRSFLLHCVQIDALTQLVAHRDGI